MDVGTWLIEQYVEGRLPAPGALLQAVMNAWVELHFRFAPPVAELPSDADGSSGPIAQRAGDLMQSHYDRSAELFENFLGPTMKYSMGLWDAGARNLEEAQAHMMADVCEKARLEDGQEVLDLGCGFGAFAEYLLERYPHTRVTGITLSRVQYDYMTARQSQPGHALHTDRFRVVQQDFSEADVDRQYDRIVSLGVFEHIANLRLALEKLAAFLKPEGAVLLHYIVYHKLTSYMADRTPGFIGRHIFPGGRPWPFEQLARYQEHLRLEQSWFLNGSNYRRTLEAWLANFQRNLPAIRRIEGIDERGMRLWSAYLRFCIAVFKGLGGRNFGNGQYLLRHA